MGITNFHKMIKEKYATAFQNKWLESYDHIYVDLNYTLHFCSYNAKNEDDVFSRVFNFFDNLLAELNPNKTLTVCSDGVAPLAKLVLQRQRRLSVSKNVSDNNTDNESFNTMVFTPGTNFMKNLKNKLKKYFYFVEQIYSIHIEYLNEQIDEAELKLKYQLMENMKSCPDDTHLIVTNDADVVVMLTTLVNPYYTFACSRTNSQNEILSIGKMLDLHTDHVGTSLYPNYDFALVSLMMGNDYLPKIRLADFEKLWESYKSTLKILPNGLTTCNINSTNLTNPTIEINKNFLVKMLNKLILISKQKSLNFVTIRNGFGNMYLNYIDGLTWCLQTYNTGKCVRYDYMYEYQESPHPLGIVFNIIENPNLLIAKNTICKPIDQSLYAILLLPNFAKNLIDKKFHKFMENNDILYLIERCKECKEFNSKIKNLKTDISNTEEEFENISLTSSNNDVLSEKSKEIESKLKQLKNENVLLGKKFTAHKKNHDRLNLSDIKNIISNFESYCKS